MNSNPRALARAAAAFACAAVVGSASFLAAVDAHAASDGASASPALRGTRAPQPVHGLSNWVERSGDARGLPYAIVDKKAARLYVFDKHHRLAGVTAVLIGQTVGDHTVAGVGERAQVGRVGLNERTTPAGRFESAPGRNLDGEDVVWLDYDAAFAIHRLRPGPGHAARLARLRTPTPADNRASYGCVVVPAVFYLDVVQPLLGRQRGMVYVMPETRAHEGVLPPEV